VAAGSYWKIRVERTRTVALFTLLSLGLSACVGTQRLRVESAVPESIVHFEYAQGAPPSAFSGGRFRTLSEVPVRFRKKSAIVPLVIGAVSSLVIAAVGIGVVAENDSDAFSIFEDAAGAGMVAAGGAGALAMGLGAVVLAARPATVVRFSLEGSSKSIEIAMPYDQRVIELEDAAP